MYVSIEESVCKHVDFVCSNCLPISFSTESVAANALSFEPFVVYNYKKQNYVVILLARTEGMTLLCCWKSMIKLGVSVC